MAEFDTPDKDNIIESSGQTTPEIPDNDELTGEISPYEVVNDTENGETADADNESEYQTDSDSYEYIEEETEELSQTQETGEDEVCDEYDDASYDAHVLSRFKLFVAQKIYAFGQLDKKQKRKRIFISAVVLVLLVLIFTDIIPILPNSYHRSYVGNKYTLGETMGNDVEKYGDNVLYASGGSVICFGPDMSPESTIDTFSGTPIIRTTGEGAIVYSKNGDTALVMTSPDKYKLVDSDEAIISASVNEDGDYILVTVEAGYKACLSAYNSTGQSLYKWHTGSNIIDTAISPDGAEIVASVVEYSQTDIYSKLVFLNTSSKTPVKEVKLDSCIASELVFADANTLIAFGDAFTAAYTPNGSLKWNIDYGGKLLKTYDISDEGNIAFLFNRYNSDLSESRIEIYNTRGKLTGEYDSKSNVRSISINNDFCLLSLDKQTILTDNDGDVRKSKKVDAEYSKMVLYDNYNFAFGINDSIAEILSVKH